MKKTIIAATIAALMSSGAFAQNLGFEDGSTTGWTSTTLSAVGSTTTQAGPNTWVINPYGSYMGRLQIQSGNYNQMATALGLTSSSSTAITTLLQQQAQVSGGSPNPTTAGWVTREVTLTAGQTFTLAWQYVSVDYVPFNDGSIATLTQNGTTNATVNNYNQQYALLGFTNPGTGDYSTGSYGATGWQVATFQVSVDGTYTLGFGVFNLGDTALSPVLYIDEVQGTTTKNGQSFGAVAPNNSTAPSSPSAPPPAPTTVSTVASGTTVDTSNLASNVTVNGGTIQIATNNVTLTNTFVADAGGMTVDQNGNVSTFNGVISGSGGVTISNSGTGGGVTFAAVNTYTGTTTVNSGASLTNTGTIAGTLTNLGSLTNSGTTGNLTNGFNGDGNTASMINSGTVGNVQNFSSFSNSGTTGNVLNFGTFTNTGTTGAFQNVGVLNNNVGGTIGELAYNNYWIQNSGTINNITYNGGSLFNNPGGVIGTINNTEAHGNFFNYGNVTGAVTTNSTFNNYEGAVVQGLYTNNGVLNNAGVVGAVINNGTFNNTGTAGAVTLNTGSTFSNTGTVASVDNAAGISLTNNGTITGTLSNTGNVASLTNNGIIGDVTGTITDVTNTGTMTNSGTITTLINSGTAVNNGNVNGVDNTGTYTNNGTTGAFTNSGTLNYNGGTLGDYAQVAGTTVMNFATPIAVSNNAVLGGNLTINDSPTAYGKYSVLTANSVTGAYGSFTSAGANDYLKYSGTDVKLYVTPSATQTQASINSVSSNLGNAINLQSSTAQNVLGNDCNLFGDTGSCVSVNFNQTAAAGGDLQSGGITVGKRINENWRIGAFTNSPFNSTSVGTIDIKSNTAYGGYVGWNKNANGQGLGVTASLAQGNGSMKITRNGPEVGVGTSNTDTTAYQIRANYVMPVTETVTLTPYVGVRRTQTSASGYTEQGPVFPLTVNATSYSSSDIIAGTSISKQLTDKLSANISAGVVQRISQTNPTFAGTSEIGSLSTFNGAVPNNGTTNPIFGAGVNYSIDKTTRVGVSAGIQQNGSNANINSLGITLTKGF